MKPENARARSVVISISLPRELAYQLYDLVEARKIKLSRLVATMVAEALGADPNQLRGPGHPATGRRGKEPDYYDKIKEAMGEMAPSRRELRKLFTAPTLESDPVV